MHSWLITPDVVNTNGVNEPCSTSITRRLYCLFLSISCFRRIALIDASCWLLLSGFVILTSKKAFCPLHQKPRARMSRRALSSRFADLRYPCLLVTGWSVGSVSASLLTIFRRLPRLEYYRTHVHDHIEIIYASMLPGFFAIRSI